MEKKNKNVLLWGLSLIVIGIGSIILAVSDIIGAELPDILVRIIGIADICALPVLSYTSVKLIKKAE